MPTKNLKTDYGAYGDGQKTTANLSVNPATPTQFISFSNLFISGDVGKRIAIAGVLDDFDGTNPLETWFGNITAVGAYSGGQQTITVTNAYSGFSFDQALTNQSTTLEWGHDDNFAFAALRAEFAGTGTPVVLTVPAGRYCIAGITGNNGIFFGLSDLTVNCNVSTVLSVMLGGSSACHLGSTLSVIVQDGYSEARTQTVSVGATTIPLITVSDHSLFSPPCWGWMQGFDTQTYGDPPNPQFSEYVYITTKNASTGVLTISAPLVNTYKSTWPMWSTHTPGPATIYPVSAAWDATHVYNNFFLEGFVYTLVNCNARNITFNGGSTDVFGPNCSMQQNFTCDGFTLPTLWEMDKGTTNCTIKNATWRGIHTYSQFATNIFLDNMHFTHFLNGTGNNCTITNSVIDVEPLIGCTSYGAPSSISISNTSIAYPITKLSGGNSSNSNGVDFADYSMSGGIISGLIADIGNPLWAIPGAYCWFTSRHYGDRGKFLVTDVYTDATHVYIQTDQTGGFPGPVSPSTGIHIDVAFPPTVSFSNVTGSYQALSISANPTKRFGEYWLATHSVSSSEPATVWGKLVSLKITVNPGFSAGWFNCDWNTPSSFIHILNNDTVTDMVYNPVVDLSVPGTRTITPSGVTGSAGFDSGLTLPCTNAWWHPEQFEVGIHSAVGSGSVTVEIITNQGWAVAPTTPVSAAARVRFRVR